MDTEKYDLLYGGGYSIKEYYMESGNPRQMRGASELLNDCVAEIEKYLLDKNVKKEHIIRSGATLSAKVPHDAGESLAFNAERIFRDYCRTANVAFVVVPFNNDYLAVKKTALDKYENRKSIKYIPWDFQNSEDASIKCEKTKLSIRCPRCRLRDAKYHTQHKNTEVLDLCTSCMKRELKSGDTKYNFRKECGREFDYEYEIDDVSDLADSDGRIAFLYADINNLGGIKLESFEKDKEFHIRVEDLVKDTVNTALKEAMTYTGVNNRGENKLCAKFEIIARGGDDICLLLPGNVALLTAKIIIDVFDKNSLGLSISVASCVANDTTAITYMENITGNALKNSKIHSHSIKTKPSTVNIRFFERKSDLFPLSAYEYNTFLNVLGKVNSIPTVVTALRNIAEARKELAFDEEFDLFYKYYISRSVAEIKNNKPIFDEIHNTYHGVNPWLDFITWRNQKLGSEVIINETY